MNSKDTKANGRPKQSRYLLLLNPYGLAYEKVHSVKNKFAVDYKAPWARKKTHISIGGFTAWNMDEPRIVSHLRNIASCICPFKVELHGFGFFATHTCFLNVVAKDMMQILVCEVKAIQHSGKISEFSPVPDSHLTICKDLEPWQFQQSFYEFSQKQFSAQFYADHMILAKREADGAYSDKFYPFVFGGGKRTTTTQGRLFD